MGRNVAFGVLATLALGFAPPASGAAGEPNASTAWAENRLVDRVVPDIPLRLADGRFARLSELWADKPLLVTFFYRRCSGICMPFLEWVRDAVREVGGLGRDYRVLALSFDDTDIVADIRAQAAALGLLREPDWSFAVAEKDEVARIAGALDYWYRLDPSTQQYDHTSLLVAIDRGRVVHALLGGPDGSERLRTLVWELRGTVIPFYRVQGQAPIRCFAFDSRSGKTRLDWGILLLLLLALAALTLASAVFIGTTRQGDGFGDRDRG